LVISVPIHSPGSGRIKANVAVGVAAMQAVLAVAVAVRVATPATRVETGVAVIAVVAIGVVIASPLISTPIRRVAPKGVGQRVKIMGFIQLLNNLKIQ
jgi:hypothetical protein